MKHPGSGDRVPTNIRWHILGIIITWHIMYGAFILSVADHVREGIMP